MSIMDLEAIDAAECTVRSLMRRGMSQQRARKMVRVEVAPTYEDRIIAAAWAATDVWRCTSNVRGGRYPMMIKGISYYRVDALPDGDEWRVINPLDVL